MIPLNLGIRAHDLVAPSPIDLVNKLKKYEFPIIQLAIKKSFPDLAPNLSQITNGTANYLGTTLTMNQIKVAVLGCYVNISSKNPAIRNKAVLDFKHHLTLAKDLNCTLVGTESGSVGEGFTLDNFKEESYILARNSVIEMVKDAEKLGVLVGIEAGYHSPFYRFELLERLLNEVQSPNLKIIFDPANLMRLDNYSQQEKVIYEAINHLQDHIAVIHLKDYIIDQGKIKIVPVGDGKMDYRDVLQFIKYDRPMMYTTFEGVKEDHILESKEHIYQLYNSL